jgi:hypothetical protein
MPSSRRLLISTHAAVNAPEARRCRQLRLRQEAYRRAARYQIGHILLDASRDQDHRCPIVRIIRDQAPRNVEAALFPERDVDEDDVRPQDLGLPESLRARRRDARDGHALSLQQHPGGNEKRWVVIDDQASNLHAFSMTSFASQGITASKNAMSSGRRATAHRTRMWRSMADLLPAMLHETVWGRLVADPDARARCLSRDLVARGRYRVPAGTVRHDALPVRVAGILVSREEVERMAGVGDL